jgi:hypothetical protein
MYKKIGIVKRRILQPVYIELNYGGFFGEYINRLSRDLRYLTSLFV